MDKPHIYKITNNINGKFYYGVHNGSNTDTYMGSGRLIKKALNKYGIDNFSKEILMWFDTMDEAYEYEGVVVNQKTVDNPMCYNLCLGGMGSSGFKHSEEAKKAISKSLIGHKRNVGNKLSKKTKDRMSKAHKGKIKTDEHCKNLSKALKGKKRPNSNFSDKAREAMRKVNSLKVECPHCGKVGSQGPMKQWHFNNCKVLKDNV